MWKIHAIKIIFIPYKISISCFLILLDLDAIANRNWLSIMFPRIPFSSIIRKRKVSWLFGSSFASYTTTHLKRCFAVIIDVNAPRVKVLAEQIWTWTLCRNPHAHNPYVECLRPCLPVPVARTEVGFKDSVHSDCQLSFVNTGKYWRIYFDQQRSILQLCGKHHCA